MALERQHTTAEAFDEFIQRADLGDRIFELVDGEILEVPSNPYVSSIALRIAGFLFIYLLKNPIGYVTGEAGLYMIGGERYAPDVAYISKARQPELAHSGANPTPPELAVEVVSDENSAAELRTLRLKISNYHAVGTVVWVVNPTARGVEVHVPGQAVQTLSEQDTLDGGEILPGFTLLVGEIFAS
jgi:Uma2 family endonuclease